MPGPVTSDRDPKPCTRCGVEKPLTEFYRKPSKAHNPTRVLYTAHCKTCAVLKVQRYVAANREQVQARRKAHYQRVGSRVYNHTALDRSHARRFNVARGAFDVQLAIQNDVCAICQKPREQEGQRFAFDHDHQTGLTRGVLCGTCNNGLGCFKDNIRLLAAAISYLQGWIEQHQPGESNARLLA